MLEVQLANIYGSSLDLEFFCSLAPCYMYFKSAQKIALHSKMVVQSAHAPWVLVVIQKFIENK